jgi:DNA-binding NtrC family response regulator
LPLDDCRILVVEDEYMLACDLRQELEDAGAVVVGPEPSVARALSRISNEGRIDAAVLDVNLGGESAFPIADALAAEGIPFVFASGYGDDAVATRYPGTVNCSKPLNMAALLTSLEQAMHSA